ncbi:glutathione S-transferase T3-like [Miscanthus floridulus]|uniref:glutathione S-transferase T3-like n=1 Tax=Miscanthus floridulus TaxID=154761 RepID=UPI003458B9F5
MELSPCVSLATQASYRFIYPWRDSKSQLRRRLPREDWIQIPSRSASWTRTDTVAVAALLPILSDDGSYALNDSARVDFCCVLGFICGMEMQVDDPNFLSNILGEVEAGASLEDMDIGLTQDTQPHDELQVSRSTKPGAAKRKKNFHWQEDEIICSGWLNVSKDPIHGANQTRSSFWGRIHAYYEEHKETPDERTVSSIMHRWLTIQLQVNKFCSCYEAILRRNQSGLTIDDKIIEAKKLYVEWDKDDKTFGLLHCWKILKGEDKWKLKMIELAEVEKEKQASKKKQKSSRPRDEGATYDDGTHNDATHNDALIEAEDEQTLPKKRSDGIKKVKANMKRGGGEACMEALDKMMAKREVLEKAKEARFMASLEVEKAALELEKKRVASEEKKAEAKLLKEEKDIMLADMSSLTPTQRAWVEKKQKMIMEKMEEN